MRRIALTLVLLGCGVRTPLGTSTDTETCAPKPPNCDHWVLGANHLIASASPTEEFGLGAATATDCGVLVSWERITVGPPRQTVHQETTRLAPDGSRTNEPNHTTFSDGASSETWLASRGSRIAILQGDHGDHPCVLVSLDANGANAGPVVQTPNISTCMDLAATEDGFSFLSPLSNGELLNLDSAGAIVARTSLNVPPTRDLCGRTMLDDGSFILYSVNRDPVAPPSAPPQYTHWLRHFDSKGRPLADEVAINRSYVYSLLVAQSGSGLLVAGQFGPLDVLPTNRDGVPTAPLINVSLTGFTYMRWFVALPNGDVMALAMDNDFHMIAYQLAPSGTPRSLGLMLPFQGAAAFTSVVSPNGDLLITYVDINTHDVRVQSLTCVP